MDKFKNFLRGKKIDKHFKQSGKGARLSETSSTSAPSVVSGSSQVCSILVTFFFFGQNSA